MTQIVDRKVEFVTPWFQLVSKRVARAGLCVCGRFYGPG
jgi:hypothetical protein